jgi:hypothetical protein
MIQESFARGAAGRMTKKILWRSRPQDRSSSISTFDLFFHFSCAWNPWSIIKELQDGSESLAPKYGGKCFCYRHSGLDWHCSILGLAHCSSTLFQYWYICSWVCILIPSTQLLRSPIFHRMVGRVHQKVQHIRYGVPPEEQGGTKLEGQGMFGISIWWIVWLICSG